MTHMLAPVVMVVLNLKAGFDVYFRKKGCPLVLYGSGYSLEEADKAEADLLEVRDL